MYMCCMNHSICLDRMKNSSEYITLSCPTVFFSSIHRSFALTCTRKHQKKILYRQCARSKKGMQYPCNLSMIFEYPFFKHQNVRKPHKKSILLLCIRLEAQCLLSVIYISFLMPMPLRLQTDSTFPTVCVLHPSGLLHHWIASGCCCSLLR